MAVHRLSAVPQAALERLRQIGADPFAAVVDVSTVDVCTRCKQENCTAGIRSLPRITCAVTGA
jgi:hypothetical protein